MSETNQDRKLSDKNEIASAFNLPSASTVERLRRARKIPFIKLGYRTIRFDPIKVRAALDRLSVKEIGA